MSFAFVNSRATRLIITTSAIAAAVTWTACSKDSTGPAKIVAGNTVLPMNANVADAVVGTQFVFPAGAGALSSAVAGQNLSLTFGGTETALTAAMSVTSPTGTTLGTFSANVTFGSCIFVVTNSTFPAGHPLSNGQTVTVNPCSLNVATAGAQANGVATSRSVAMVLGAAASSGQSVTINVNAGGQLTINGNAVGQVTLVPVSG